MIAVASKFSEYQVLSLHTGAPIAEIDRPIIDPKKFKIIAFVLKNGIVRAENSILRAEEVREVGLVHDRMGLIINSADDLADINDLPKIRQTADLNFRLIGHKVISARGKKLGVVSDYLFDSISFIIQQIVARRPFIYTFNNPELLISRTQIAEIDDDKIILKDTAAEVPQPVEIPANSAPDFINPFRKVKSSSE